MKMNNYRSYIPELEMTRVITHHSKTRLCKHINNIRCRHTKGLAGSRYCFGTCYYASVADVHGIMWTAYAVVHS